MSDNLVDVDVTKEQAMGYFYDKKIEVTVSIDSPVDATNLFIECILYEKVDKEKYRLALTAMNPEGMESKKNDKGVFINPTKLVKGENRLKFRFGPASIESLEDKPPNYDKEAWESLFRDGPYTVFCRMMGFQVREKSFETRSTTNGLEHFDFTDGYNTFQKVSGESSYSYVNSGLYKTAPYKKSDFKKTW